MQQIQIKIVHHNYVKAISLTKIYSYFIIKMDLIFTVSSLSVQVTYEYMCTYNNKQTSAFLCIFKKAFLNPRKNGVGWGYILIFVWVIIKVCLCINSAKINKTYISIMCFFSLERKRSPFNWTTNPLQKHLQITICSNEIKLKPFIELSKPFIHCGRYIHTTF